LIKSGQADFDLPENADSNLRAYTLKLVTRSPCCLISIFWYLGSSFGFGQSRLAVLRDVSGLEPQFFLVLPVLPAEF
jgi:hypothetical protein